MLGFRAKRTRNIKVGFKGPTLHTGPRRSRVVSGFCDTIGEFLYEVCSAVLYRYGGYNDEEFEPSVWGDYIGVHHCTDEEVKHYAHDIVRVARTAMKRNELLGFEVSIVDGADFPLCTFTIHFRKRPRFRDSAMWQNLKPHRDMIENLGKILQNIHRIPISEEMRGFLSNVGSRLRVRLQVDEGFKELAEECELTEDCGLPQPWHTEFIPIGDPVTNVFNQMFFTAMVNPPPSTNDQDTHWELYGVYQ